MHMLTIKEKTIQDLAYCIKRCDLELAGVASSSYASALSSLVEDEKDIDLKKSLININQDLEKIDFYPSVHFISFNPLSIKSVNLSFFLSSVKDFLTLSRRSDFVSNKIS